MQATICYIDEVQKTTLDKQLRIHLQWLINIQYSSKITSYNPPGIFFINTPLITFFVYLYFNNSVMSYSEQKIKKKAEDEKFLCFSTIK
jgi:hypothetical protein